MLIKKAIVLLLAVRLFIIPVTALDETDLSAKAAVVMDAETKSVVYQKNSDKKLSMASTTKIMTCLLAIESGKMNCIVKAEEDVICDGTSIGISRGDEFTLNTLIHAMLLESGNDAAVLTAKYLAGSEEEFSVLMNRRAVQLGMKNTNFVTASGLDSEKHYSTAYDMALLGSFAIENPIFRSICSKKNYAAEYIYPDVKANYSNHNKLLNLYDGTVGIKTGFTKKSGRCLVSACERNGRTLVAVTLNAPDDWNDHIKLFDYCFGIADRSALDLYCPEKVIIYGGNRSEVSLNIPEISVFGPGENVETVLILPRFLYAPVDEGEVVGSVALYSDGKKIHEYPVAAAESVTLLNVKSNTDADIKLKLKYLFYKLLKG